MPLLHKLVDIFLHTDKNLAMLIGQYGTLSYGLIFLIIFMETGFVVTPFLPGDSLIFATGALAAKEILIPIGTYLLLIVAAILGDTVNYWIGNFIGPRVVEMDNKIIKKKYIEDTHRFYEKYGNKTIVLARFVPIIRTFAPFVAGVAKMNYKEFISFNAVGGILWVSLFYGAGYFFGNIGFVKNNFEYVVLAIIIISLVPMIYEVVKSLKRKRGE